ncbi:hypothetical protein COLO4_06225 [Corchorus olitorius]|uniref:Uncharacterized protein n=1 Tax=Corchorus olitorius TaxID=93759 RepID=A0A1R3KNJ6_9ROSI|nr:hypothetical protein COLO4_06225 [Corchorus olitorius]
MESEAEKESMIYTPKLPLFSSSHAHMESASGSPWHASASVPFRWEEQPGKPKPCTTLATFSSSDFVPKCLELPPCRLLIDAKNNNSKLPSPTTVLDGPYMGGGGGRARAQSSSFRMAASECYGSFRAGSFSPEMEHFGAMVVSKRSGYKEKGFLGSWKRRVLKGSRSDVGANSYVFPTYGDNYYYRDSDQYIRELFGEESSSSRGNSTSVKITRITRVGSFPTLPHPKSHFWASIYEGIKQVVPWSKRAKKDGFMG